MRESSEHYPTKDDMTDEKDEGLKSYQVVDRRRFDSDGNERDQSSRFTAPPEGVVAAAVPPNGAEPARTAEQAAEDAARASAHSSSAAAYQAAVSEFQMEPGETQEGDVSFTSFVMSLATQSLVQLGEMDPPPGMEIPVDVESARQTIDVIQMLQRKTRGNLSGDEARFIEEVLHTLRMSYVRRAR